MKKYIIRIESDALGIFTDITLNVSDTLIYISLLERNSIWFALYVIDDKEEEVFFTLKQFEEKLNKTK